MINSIYGKKKNGKFKKKNQRQTSKQRKKNLNTPADQLILLIKSLIKIMLLFMKLRQF